MGIQANIWLRTYRRSRIMKLWFLFSLLVCSLALGNTLKCWFCPEGEAHLCENIQENGDLVDVDGNENYCSLTIATYLDGSIVYISRDTVSTEHFEIGCRYQGEYYMQCVCNEDGCNVDDNCSC